MRIFWSTDKNGNVVFINSEQVQFVKPVRVSGSDYAEILFVGRNLIVKESAGHIYEYMTGHQGMPKDQIQKKGSAKKPS